MHPVKVQGKLIEFPSKEDRDAWLLRYLASSDSDAPRKKRPNGGSDSSANLSTAPMVASFLHVIKDGGGRGVDTSRIMKAVGITSPVAFGNRGKNINRLLTSLGYDPKDVYSNARNDKGDREWKPGPKISQALEDVNKIGEI